MRLQLVPRSESPRVYQMLISLPGLGAIAAILVYEWLPRQTLLADIVLDATWYMLAYAAFAVGWKIIRLALLRQTEMARARLIVTIKTFLLNLLIVIVFAFSQFLHSSH